MKIPPYKKKRHTIPIRKTTTIKCNKNKLFSNLFQTIVPYVYCQERSRKTNSYRGINPTKPVSEVEMEKLYINSLGGTLVDSHLSSSGSFPTCESQLWVRDLI